MKAVLTAAEEQPAQEACDVPEPGPAADSTAQLLIDKAKAHFEAIKQHNRCA